MRQYEPDYTPVPLDEKATSMIDVNIQALEKQILTCKAALVILRNLKKNGECVHPIGYHTTGSAWTDECKCMLCGHRIY